MVRPGRSSITDSRPLTYYVPERTALNIVSKHLDFLTNKLVPIDDMIRMKKGKNLDMAERELLRFRLCFKNQIKVLTILKRKFTPKSKVKNIISKVRPKVQNQALIKIKSALSLIAKLLRKRDRKLAVISKAEEYLCLGIPLVDSQEMALSYKSEVVHQMDVLERIFKEISLAQFPLTRPELGREVAEYELPPLLLRLSKFRGFVDIIEHGRLVEYEVSFLLSELRRMCDELFSDSLNMMPLQEGESSRESAVELVAACALESDRESTGVSEGDCTGVPEGESSGESEGESSGESEGESSGESEGESSGESEGESEAETPGETSGESAGNCAGESAIGRCRAISFPVWLAFMYNPENPGESAGNCAGDVRESTGDCVRESVGRCRDIRNLGREVVEYHLPPLLLHLSEFRGFVEILEHDARESTGDCVRESVRRCRAIRNLKFRPSMDENVTREVINQLDPEQPLLHKQRYLCVNTGYEIYCLNLKQSKDQTFNNAQDVPLIPRIASLDLVEENLPTSASLFKWRSNAYMIGGFKPSLDARNCPGWIRGTSCLTYGLCLAADDGIVSHSESNICKLKKPKLWPIVEEINGQIHVIDSAPSRFLYNCCGWLFSHEVFDCDTGRWAGEIPTLSTEETYVIKFHSVLGDRIYASALGASLVFDSNKKKWEAYPKRVPDQRPKDLHSFKEVWHVLELGPGKCVGRFPYGGGEASGPLYVVIALQLDGRDHPNGTHALACLVTSTGKILCIQHLHDFFKGPVGLLNIFVATIIEADEEGKTMCSVVCGETWDAAYGWDFLFINIFGVEMLSDAAPRVRELLAKGSSKAWPIEQEFVRIDTKDTYLYRTHDEVEWVLRGIYWADIQACFL